MDGTTCWSDCRYMAMCPFSPYFLYDKTLSYARRNFICDCRGLDTTYAKGWLIMVGASRTSPVPGSGIRRRHERRRTLPRFGALQGDNTPSPALRGLRMITKAQVIQWCSSSCVLEVEGGKASSLPALGGWLVLMEWEPFAWVAWGVYIGLPPGVQW